MRQGWEVKKLGEVCVIKPPKKEAKDKLKDTDFVTFLPMEDLGISSKEVIPLKERQLKDVVGSYTYFAENDVLLAKITPCFENGKVGISRNLTNGIGFGSSEYIVFRSKGEVIQDYLFYFLSRESFRQEGKKFMSGAVGHKRVSKEFIDNFLLPFPKSLPEQQRIVAILDEVFDGITKAKANAEQNLKNAQELFESYLQSVFETKGEGWEEKRLGEISKINYGYTEKASFEEIGPKFLRITDIQDNNVAWETVPYCKCKQSDLPKYKLETGDIVFARTGATTGKSYLLDNPPESIFASYLIRLKLISKKDFIPEFVAYYFQTKTYWDKINAGISGSAQGGFNASKLGELIFSFPETLKDQQTIVKKLDALSLETKKLETIYLTKIADLEELKKSILHKAFNGELK